MSSSLSMALTWSAMFLLIVYFDKNKLPPLFNELSLKGFGKFWVTKEMLDFVDIIQTELFISGVVSDADVLESILHLLQDLFSCWVNSSSH